MNVVDSRRYVGLQFGLSVSASNFDEDQRLASEDSVNRLVFQEASHILLEGGSLVLGHRWQADGIMEHLASRARELRSYQRSVTGSSTESAAVINMLAWPDPPPSEKDKTAQQLLSQKIMAVEQVGPEGIEVQNVAPDSDLGRFCRIRALTNMRKKVVNMTDVRICFGGAASKSGRRLPGVLEEAMFAIQAGRPVYISSALGGVSRVMADALLHRRLNDWDRQQFATNPDARALMESFAGNYPYPIEEGPSVVDDPTNSNWSALKVFQQQDVNQLAANAHLNNSEYINLLTTADIDRALTLIATAVQRMRSPNPS